MIKINKVESTGYDNGVDKNTKGTWKGDVEMSRAIEIGSIDSLVSRENGLER